MLASAEAAEAPAMADRWAWGSRSMAMGVAPRAARAAARLSAVVVLPTPPFWLKTAIRATRACRRFSWTRVPPGDAGSLAEFWNHIRHEISALAIVPEKAPQQWRARP